MNTNTNMIYVYVYDISDVKSLWRLMRVSWHASYKSKE